MNININETEYDIGYNIEYPQTNETTGVPSDKMKYRLAQQNNLILTAIQAMASVISQLSDAIKSMLFAYIWAADDSTIMASDDDTILIFYSDMGKLIDEMQTRVDGIEEDVDQLASQPVITYEEHT